MAIQRFKEQLAVSIAKIVFARESASFKRLILRAVLRQVSPMVIRLVSVCETISSN
jgi:hypothetical protein